jgi:hypothetical protein
MASHIVKFVVCALKGYSIAIVSQIQSEVYKYEGVLHSQYFFDCLS